jgi:hypothetical protein
MTSSGCGLVDNVIIILPSILRVDMTGLGCAQINIIIINRPLGTTK